MEPWHCIATLTRQHHHQIINFSSLKLPIAHCWMALGRAGWVHICHLRSLNSKKIMSRVGVPNLKSIILQG